MSTAGKVLGVLVLVGMIGWLVLAAKVADLNDNWGAELKKQQKQAATLETELATQEEAGAKRRTEIAQAQAAHDQRRVVHRIALADTEKALSETLESLDRVKFQVKGQQAAEATAENLKKIRNDEKAETIKLIEQTKDEVKKLTDDTNALTARLNKLENDFIATRTENEKLVRRVSNR